jgi:hypothetical protein
MSLTPEPPPPPPGDAHLVRESAERRARLRRVLGFREWSRLPAPLLIALVLHGGAGWWLWTQVRVLEPAELALVAQVTAQELEDLLEPEPEPPPIELVEPDDVEFEPLLTELSESSVVVDMLGLGSSGLGGRGGRGLSLLGDQQDDFGGQASPFRDFVDDLRLRGVDVCFVIDSTGSMQRFIDRARQTVDRIVADLATVVPDARLAVVAYRDLNDDWVTRRTELTSNRYLVHNFLIDLVASGGKRDYADFEEAVEVGLAVASQELAWRSGARRVLILVGDAPYHKEDRGEAISVVRDFVREEHSVVNTVYVGVPGEGRTTAGAKATKDAFERIAKAGKGHSFHLALERDPDNSGPTALGAYRIHHSGSGDDETEQELEDPEVALLRRQVLDATFGPEWRDEIDRLLETAPKDGRRIMAERREGRGDTRWFSRQLLEGRLHPAIIDGARRIFDVRIAVSCLLILEDEAAGSSMRAAVLNILKMRMVDVLTGISLDVNRPLAEEDQRRVMAVIHNRVLDLPNAALLLAKLKPPTPPTSPPAPQDG